MNPETVLKLVQNPFYAVEISPALRQQVSQQSREEWVRSNVDLMNQIGPEQWVRSLLEGLEGGFVSNPDQIQNPTRAVKIDESLCLPHSTMLPLEQWVGANVNLLTNDPDVTAARWLLSLLEVLGGGFVTSDDPRMSGHTAQPQQRPPRWMRRRRRE